MERSPNMAGGKKQIRINIHSIVVESLGHTKTDSKNHLKAVVSLTIWAFGKSYDMKVPVTVPYGDSPIYAELEVGSVKEAGYDLAWNHAQFREIVQRYFRKVVGEKGAAIAMKNPDNTQVRMKATTVNLKYSEVMYVDPVSGGSW